MNTNIEEIKSNYVPKVIIVFKRVRLPKKLAYTNITYNKLDIINGDNHSSLYE